MGCAASVDAHPLSRSAAQPVPMPRSTVAKASPEMPAAPPRDVNCSAGRTVADENAAAATWHWKVGDYALAPFDGVSGAPCRIHEVVRDGDVHEPESSVNARPEPIYGFLVRFVEDGVDAPRVFVAVDDLQPIPRYPVGARLLVLHRFVSSATQPSYDAENDDDSDGTDAPDGWWMSSLRPNHAKRTDASAPSRTDDDCASASHVDIGWLGEADTLDVTLRPCRVLAVMERDGACSYVVRLLPAGLGAGTDDDGNLDSQCNYTGQTATVDEWQLMRGEEPI